MQNYNNLSPKMTHQNASALMRRIVYGTLTLGDAYALP